MMSGSHVVPRRLEGGIQKQGNRSRFRPRRLDCPPLKLEDRTIDALKG
jgi:hypothetical protein